MKDLIPPLAGQAPEETEIVEGMGKMRGSPWLRRGRIPLCGLPSSPLLEERGLTK